MIEDVMEFHRRHKHEEFGPQFARSIEWPNGPITTGETVRIAASYENLGATETSTTATLLVDGESVDTIDVTVAPGDSERVAFEYSFESPGDYTVSVDEAASESLEVAAEETATEAATDTDSAADSSSPQAESTAVDQPGFGVLQAVTALSGLSYVIKKRLSDDRN